jgi:hypothetical protein
MAADQAPIAANKILVIFVAMFQQCPKFTPTSASLDSQGLPAVIGA